MKITLLGSLVLVLCFIQCKQPESASTLTASQQDSVARNTILPQPISVDLEDTKPDTLVFKQKEATYRLLDDTVNYRYAIQRLENTEWQTLDSFERPRGLEVKDINQDGFYDILMQQRWHVDMALFNPISKIFEKPFDIGEPDGFFLIDEKQQLYASVLTNKFEDIHSRLFSFENYRPILRGYIQGFVGDETFSNREKPRGVYVCKFINTAISEDSLYEESNLQLIEKFTLKDYNKENKSVYGFYKSYWLKNAANF
jgi:hypothetical protein